MRRSAKTGGGQTASRGTTKVARKRRSRPTARRRASVLSTGNEELRRQLEEAYQQQTATADVLKIISRSTFDLQTVLDALVKSATELCEAQDAFIFLPAGDVFRAAARYGFTSESHKYIESNPPRFNRGSVTGRAAIDASVVHISDVLADPEYTRRDFAKIGGYRAALGVPLLREGKVVGVIFLSRTKPQPFTDKQVELVATFAAQAIIAIENARLLNELRESLQQQTATADVLKVISRSTFDLQPVFDSMAESAVRLCEAERAYIFRFDGEMLRAVASFNAGPENQDWVYRNPIPLGRHSVSARAGLERRTVQVADIQADPEYHYVARDVDPIRTTLAVPMLKGDELIGTITIYRLEVKPFSSNQIALMETFADQAVIAIENVRLFEAEQQRTRELTESLERQTATSEVLRVISSSPGQLEPVFQTMLENAVKICGAKFGNLFLRDDEGIRIGATYGAPQTYVNFLHREGSLQDLHPDVGVARLMRTKEPYQVTDLAASPTLGDKLREATIELAGARTLIGVPMLKDGQAIGAIIIYRQEIKPFTDKQIALVQNFAAQAVIAIENTRLLNELRQSLQRQAATADVLKVISRSTFDLQTVFQTLIESAARLCTADRANISRLQGGTFQHLAVHGFDEGYLEYMQAHPLKLDRGSINGRTALDRRVVHAHDVLADREYTLHEAQKLGSFRTALGVPLLREGIPMGTMFLGRSRVEPFTQQEIDLVTTFADQAVIAIENVRLFEAEQQRSMELSESLERQTATSEVLRAISSSPGELKPIFSAMLSNAVRICEAKVGNLFLWDGDDFRAVAVHGESDYADWFRRDPMARVHEQPGSPLDRLVRGKEVIHIPDLQQDQSYIDGNHRIVSLVETAGARTHLVVPMLKDRELIGAIVIYRREVRPFAEKQIELVRNFASQAVIAIENARLLTELRQSLDQQTATAEVLKVISRSTFDLKSVLNTLVESAAQLCEADLASIPRQTGAIFDHVATFGYSPEFQELLRRHPMVPGRGTITGRVMLEGKTTHIPDVLDDPNYDFAEGQGQKTGGYRTILGVPLMRGGAAIGVLILGRSAVRPFTPQQIELAETFADQAVIAIENVRLFEAEQQRTKELAKSLEDLRTAQDRLVQTQKLASLGQLTAGIAHEIKNPLNFVNNFSGLSVELLAELQEAVESGTFDDKRCTEIAELTDALRGNLDKIAQHGKRADSIVKNMLLHSREGSGEQRTVDINAIVEESLNLAYHGARAEKQGFNITLQRSFDPDAGQADLYPQEISRALLNFISNGFYAATKRQREMGDGYEPTLAAATKNLGGRVEIRIRDNGTGIPPEVKEKMFNPFFTTKPAGEGTGLGLSISHDIIVKQHLGTIEVDSAPGEFTEIRIVLPRTTSLSSKPGG